MLAGPWDRIPGMGEVTLRYWASAAAAAGVDSDVVNLPPGATLAEVKALAVSLHPTPRFKDVLACCSVLIGDRPANGDDSWAVPDGASVEFLPPFAGG